MLKKKNLKKCKYAFKIRKTAIKMIRDQVNTDKKEKQKQGEAK